MALPQIQNLTRSDIVGYNQEEKARVHDGQLKFRINSFFTLAISSWLVLLFILASLFGMI